MCDDLFPGSAAANSYLATACSGHVISISEGNGEGEIGTDQWAGLIVDFWINVFLWEILLDIWNQARGSVCV